MPDRGPPAHELWMTRFSGLEIYRIKSARWNLYREQDDEQRMNLWLDVRCSDAIQQAEDSAYIAGIPHWELNLVASELTEIDLMEGFTAHIPKAYDEGRDGWITNFYFTSHEGSDRNSIQVLDRDADRVLIRLEGEIIDVCFGDDSKPRSKLLVETWFEKYSRGVRSLQ